MYSGVSTSPFCIIKKYLDKNYGQFYKQVRVHKTPLFPEKKYRQKQKNYRSYFYKEKQLFYLAYYIFEPCISW